MDMRKKDPEYAKGQLKLSEVTSRQGHFSVTGGNIDGQYRFENAFYGLTDIPTTCQKKQPER